MHAPPADQMHVQVGYCLSAVVAGVDYHPIATPIDFFLHSEIPGYQEKMLDERLIGCLQFIQGFNVLVWRNQNMNGANGTDIAECGGLLIPINDARISFVVDDPAEYTGLDAHQAMAIVLGRTSKSNRRVCRFRAA
jgi:hypothetical protein